MEEQEIPLGLGKVYRFIPAERNDTVRNIGRPKYLPVEICGDDEVNCDCVTNQNALTASDRRIRDVFSNLGALHNLARLEDLDLEDISE